MAKWTVMVFMGADGVEGNKQLQQEAADDLEEMTDVGATATLDIFVEAHAVGQSKRIRVGQGSPAISSASLGGAESFANGVALTRFVEWALDESGHGPDDYSMLVLWGHAYRFALGHTETQVGIDALDFAELAMVLRRLQESKKRQYATQGRTGKEPPKLDIVAFDACSIATIEMAYQLSPYARYLVASQVGIPLPGWPYRSILERLANPKGRVMGPAELGSYAVRRYCEHYEALDRSVTLSHLDLRQAPRLLQLVDELARKLAIAVDDDSNELTLVARLFDLSQTMEGEPFVDVASLCRHLVRYSGDAAVRRAARALGDALASPRGVGAGLSESGELEPFVIEQGSNSIDGAGLYGVSLYAPNVAPQQDFGAASHFYEKFVFARDTIWKDLVRALALPTGASC